MTITITLPDRTTPDDPVTGPLTSVLDFGATGDGTTDDTAAFQAASAYAALQPKGEIYVPAGTYVISSTVDIGTNALRGVGRGSEILTTIDNGSPVFNFVAGSNFFSVQGIYVNSSVNTTQFESGEADALDCIAFKIRSSGSTYSARFVMRDVIARGCKVGYDITGFIITLENVWGLYCETGFIGVTMNSSRMHLRFEQCRKDFALSDSDGVHIDQYISEGAVLQADLVASTIDDCRGVTIGAMYLEQVRTVPFLIVGGTAACNSFTIHGLYVATADNAATDYDIVPIEFDQVDGLSVEGFFSTGAHHNRYSTTANTKNIRDNTVSTSASVWAPHDASKNIGPARNLFANSNFDMWFRGWPSVDIIRCALTQETTIVRRGKNAIRLTMTAAQANGYVSFNHNDGYLGAKLAGKSVTAYAWIWIPDTADFDPAGGASQTTQVDLGIYFDGTGSTSVRSDSATTVRGAWNLFRVSATLPANCTRIDIFPRILINNGSATGAEYIVVDSIFLIEGNGGQNQHIANGWIMDSDIIQTVGLGGRMNMRSDSAPTDVDQTFEVGDEVTKFTIAAAGSPGWFCTTGGAGGTAVFKAKAAVAA
jgi:hypothetical protein